MGDHNRRKEDRIEAAIDVTMPQTPDELARMTYRTVKKIDIIVCGPDGKGGLCDRMTVLETIVYVLAWVMGIGGPSLIIYVTFFKHG